MEIKNEIIVFEVWGDYACFRQPHTTVNPLTWDFPPRTTIIGMVAAIFGLERDSYYEKLSPQLCDVGIRIMNPVKKEMRTFNLIDTKEKKKQNLRTQIRFQLIKNPKYRIYFRHKDEKINQELKQRLEKKGSHFTLTLGNADCLAHYKFIGTRKIEEKDLEEVHTVALFNKLKMREIGEKEIFKKRMPRSFKEKRICELEDYLYERNGESIKAITKGYLVEGEGVVFL